MLDYVAEELSGTPGWRRVLEAYASLTAAAVQTTPSNASTEPAEAIGWASRLTQLEGVEPEQMRPVHGKLIALGLLSFEVSGKTGMQYQLSPLGYRTLGMRAQGRRTVDRDAQERSSDEATASEADDSDSAAA